MPLKSPSKLISDRRLPTWVNGRFLAAIHRFVPVAADGLPNGNGRFMRHNGQSAQRSKDRSALIVKARIS
jgi:hypothetical protein